MTTLKKQMEKYIFKNKMLAELYTHRSYHMKKLAEIDEQIAFYMGGGLSKLDFDLNVNMDNLITAMNKVDGL